VAAAGGAKKIVLGGPEVAPAFPDGMLPDGGPSGAPPDTEARWREIIDGVRAIFPGTIALELELSDALQRPPSFVDDVDQIHIYWHPPLDPLGGGSAEQLSMEAGRWMDELVIGEARLAGKPIVLSVEVPSVAGGISGCIRTQEGGCTLASELVLGAVPDPELALDLETQTRAYSAVLSEAYRRTQVGGIYARGYNPSISLQDLSPSVRGKPAQDVLWYWFSRITGGGKP
jgi:hypothetical protein